MYEKKLVVQKPIRIAQIIGKMWAGGVESVIFNYYRSIDKTKIQFDFYYDQDSTVNPPEDLLEMGAKFIQVPPYQNVKTYISTLIKYFKKEKYIIVHSHINSISVFPLCAAKIAGVPVRIAHNHSIPGKGEFKKNVLKYFLWCFSRIFPTDYFACSEKAGRWLFGNRNYEFGKVTIITNAIDFTRFQNTKRDVVRKKYGIENRLVIGHVGRFTYAKNHKFLLKIFKEILAIRSDAVLLLVGDGELRSDIEQLIEELSLQDTVILTGKQKTTEEYYAAMDVLILPSIYEGFSITSIEAQVVGIPILVSESIPDVVTISDSCYHMSLNNSFKIWAKKAVSMANNKLTLLPNSKDYDIVKNAKGLEKIYISFINR